MINDHTVATRLVRAVDKKHRRSAAITAIKEFPQRSHFLIASPGWEEIADSCIEWAEQQVGIKPGTCTEGGALCQI